MAQAIKQANPKLERVRFKRLEIGTIFNCSVPGSVGRWRKVSGSKVVPVLANGRGNTAVKYDFAANTNCVPENK